jgi:hypothetical protein
MPSIQANSATVRGFLAVTRSNNAPQNEGQAVDGGLQHAWSIGTTRVATQFAPDRFTPSEKNASPESHPAEERPPEVYIG